MAPSPDVPVLEWRLVPLQPVDAILRQQQAALRVLFHALGGPLAWFVGTALPRVRHWESWCCEVDDAPSQAPLQLARLLAVAAQGARDIPAAAGPDWHRRLGAAHAAALDAIWCDLQGAVVVAADGTRWQPAGSSLRDWRARCGAAPLLLVTEAAGTRDPWQDASRTLAGRGIWRPGQCDRWLREDSGWALLWPLAGRDLLATLAAAGRHCADVEAVRAGLARWGHLRGPAMQARPWRRGDGRYLQCLPVESSLLPPGTV